WQISNTDFSFSGLKTAVYYHLKEHDTSKQDVAASFQRAVNDTLVYKTLDCARERNINTICVGGGVAANGPLRESFRKRAEGNVNVHFPSLELCTDNAGMIAYRAQHVDARADFTLNAQPSLSVFSPKSNKQEELTV
ncbi:MAG: carbamoyltransferase N-terminal domain-containing protein, partial [bacterium]